MAKNKNPQSVEPTLILFDHVIGDTVFIKHDPMQVARMVVGIELRGSMSNVVYQLQVADLMTYHHPFELSSEKNFATA